MFLFLSFFNDTPTTEIYTLSLHDALPIYDPGARLPEADPVFPRGRAEEVVDLLVLADRASQVVRENERSEEHTSELQSLAYLVCRLLLEKKKKKRPNVSSHANIKEPLSTV